MKFENFKKRKFLNPYLLVILSFLVVILLGSVLLTMPFTQRSGQWAPYIDALVTAVSATCVTGVATYTEGVALTLTFWGQLICIILIQIGGLGIVTLLTFFVTIFNAKLKFEDRYYISEMVSSTSVAEVVKFVRKVCIFAFSFEFLGFLLGLPVFLTMYKGDVPQALWNSLFHSISSFNNAGFDIFNSTTSLIGGLEGIHGEVIPGDSFLYYYFCTYIMILIIIGGISFLVLFELSNPHRKKHQLSSFTKICLLTSLFLILFGAIITYLSDGLKEKDSMTFFDALFQSVSCRTAGFFTYPADKLSITGKAVSEFLMFVGGNPLSTAGGIKTTTLFMIILAMYSYFRGKRVSGFKRSYSNTLVLKAMSLVFIALIIVIVSYVIICNTGFAKGVKYEDLGLQSSIEQNYLYEIFSCFGTTGFFVGIEPYLSVESKVLLCVLMFLGRLGPITFIQIFQDSIKVENEKHFEYVNEDILIG